MGQIDPYHNENPPYIVHTHSAQDHAVNLHGRRLNIDDKEAEMALLLSARNKIDNRRRRAITEAEKDECLRKRKAISKELKAMRHDINLAKGIFPIIENLKEKLRIEMEQEQEMFPRETGAQIKSKIKRNEEKQR